MTFLQHLLLDRPKKEKNQKCFVGKEKLAVSSDKGLFRLPLTAQF